MTDEERNELERVIEDEVTKKYQELKGSISEQRAEFKSSHEQFLKELKESKQSIDEIKKILDTGSDQKEEVVTILKSELEELKKKGSETKKLILHAATFFLGMIMTVFGLAIALLKSTEIITAATLMIIGAFLIVVDLLILMSGKS